MAKEQDEDSCIAGMQCPTCQRKGPFIIEATKQFLVSPEGTGDIDSDTHWNENSYCRCHECDFDGKVGDFLIVKGGEPSMPAEIRPNSVTLTDKELNQVLAALRFWQLAQGANQEELITEYFTEQGFDPFADSEIDALCELFNLGPLTGQTPARPTYEQLHDFVAMVSRMNKDGEMYDISNDDSEEQAEFEMSGDDAFATIHDLIDTARSLVTAPERAKCYDWQKGMSPEEASHYFGELQECVHCASTDGKHHSHCSYTKTLMDEMIERHNKMTGQKGSASNGKP